MSSAAATATIQAVRLAPAGDSNANAAS